MEKSKALKHAMMGTPWITMDAQLRALLRLDVRDGVLVMPSHGESNARGRRVAIVTRATTPMGNNVVQTLAR
jgi:glyoxylase-like metal-dependent hydrolase (beta-lactamase superfamily II)